MKKMNKNEDLRAAAKEFAEKAQKLSSTLEIDIVGSVAYNDTYPNDIDLALVVSNLDEIETIAKYARQMSKYYNAWEVFLFDENLRLLGKVCHRKKCPTKSIDCSVPGCGEIPYLEVDPEFKYDERLFLESPVEVLWTSVGKSHLLARKNELGIVESRRYPVLTDIEIKCIVCGKRFVFTAEEQKWYQKRGLRQPKRCPECREQRLRDELGDL